MDCVHYSLIVTSIRYNYPFQYLQVLNYVLATIFAFKISYRFQVHSCSVE